MKRQEGQSTLEWVIGAAVILGTLLIGVVAWNQGLVAKMQGLLGTMMGAQ